MTPIDDHLRSNGRLDQARRTLRLAVEEAIQTLGSGFLEDRTGNRALRNRLRSIDGFAQDYYRQVLRLVYRLLFLLVAEQTKTESGENLLHPPGTPRETRERYARNLSINRLQALLGDGHHTARSDLYRSLVGLFGKLRSGDSSFGVPAVGSFLFSTDATPDLDDAVLSNHHLLDALRQLCRIDGDEGNRPIDFGHLGAGELGTIYESLLELHPLIDTAAGPFALGTAAGHERKATGSYYTPDSLIACLLDSALDPAVREAIDRPDRRQAEQALLDLTICDPACGSGRFLIAAADRMATHLARLRTDDEQPGASCVREAKRDVINRCLYGVDVNPMAVELCKISLWMESREPGRPLSSFDRHIQLGNSLLGTTPRLLAGGLPNEAFTPVPGDDKSVCAELKKRNRRQRDRRNKNNLVIDDDRDDHAVDYAWHTNSIADMWCAAFVWAKNSTELSRSCPTAASFPISPRAQLDIAPQVRAEVARLRDEHVFFHWHLAFPEVFAPPGAHVSVQNERCGWSGGFDVVLGNPPFVNAIERPLASRAKALIRHRAPELGGTADQAFAFLYLATQIVAPTGRVSLVLPRSVLNAPAAEVFRRELQKRLPPNRIFVSKKAGLFAGAAVFVCLLSLGHDQVTRVAIADDPLTAVWHRGHLTSTNWWSAVLSAVEGVACPPVSTGTCLADRFHVSASMTATDAYDVKPAVRDQKDGDGLKLVTTGLIDPGVCLWGTERCRYLKQDYRYPRLEFAATMTKSLRQRIERAKRPKLLIAGLSKRIECFLDRDGDCVGAVSTYSVFHADDDIEVLESLARLLLSDEASERFRLVLGGNALGGGNTTMKKSFLEQFPLREVCRQVADAGPGRSLPPGARET